MDEAERAAYLERLRRSGIRVDREGRFIHEGAEVTHEGLKRALFRWLDRLPPPDGRYVLRLDERRFAYLDVDDTPLVARAARVDAAGTIWLALSDGAEEALDPATLTADAAGVLRARVRGGRLEARLATSAVAALGERLTETPDGRPALRVAGRPAPLAIPAPPAE
ncbi:MAG TPA: hypothetical protein VHO06_09965 [Polyangia bacterium]|nr:hypothetical protein [Polyangia bacterium]